MNGLFAGSRFLSRASPRLAASPLWQRAAFFSTVNESQRLVSLTASKDKKVAVITLQRPEAKNAISKAFLYDLLECVNAVRSSPDYRVVLLRSTVPGVFCAGADLKERAKMSEADARVFVMSLRDSFSSVYALPQPTVACIDGAALGGGLEIALACDFRVSSAACTVGLPETSLAIIPGAGGTQRLPRLVGVQNAKFLVYTAAKMSGKEALGHGVVDFVSGVNDQKLADKAPAGDVAAEFGEFFSSDLPAEKQPGFVLGLQLAKSILPNGPIALRAAKRAINDGMQTDIATAMDVERACYETVLPTQDRLEALAAFREKRVPNFLGK